MKYLGCVPGVVATVLAFSPSAHLGSTLQGIASQVAKPDSVVILDNGIDPEGTTALCAEIFGRNGVEYIVLPSEGNVGVGAGHNRLVAEALRREASWVWMLEHDTVCDDDCLVDLLQTVERIGDERLAAVVPNLARNDHERAIADADTFAKGQQAGSFAQRLTFNGVLVSTTALVDVGTFRDDLFVGGEDWDYSDRLANRGWLVHQRRRITGIHPTRGDHRHGVLVSPVRQYYSIRSTLLRSESWLQRLRLAAVACAGCARDLVRPQRTHRIAARLAGIVDGMRGIGGRRDGWFMTG